MNKIYILFIATTFIYLYFQKDSSPNIQPTSKPIKTSPSKLNRNIYPKEQYTAGGLAKLIFKHKPELYLNDEKLNLFTQKKKKGWLVLIPFSLYKGAQKIRLTSSTSSLYQVHLLNLDEDDYTKQYIKIKTKGYVKTSKKTWKRIRKDSLLKKETYARHSKIYIKNLKMIKPLNSALRHDFGKKRFFNGIARNPHAGMDLSGKKGDKIKASLSGEVIVLGRLFYNGNMMVIDHGQGLMSAYSHLSKFLKKDGDWVRQGEYIGEVGSTGRATGPHLHWSVYLGGEPVNPELFLDLGKSPSPKISQ